MSDPADNDRITALEETIAHQARMIEEMSGEMARQWETIDVLKKRLARLTERFTALEETATSPAESKPPPHW